MEPYTTRNGVPFDYDLAGPDGAYFTLIPRQEHTVAEISEAKRQLRADRDVAGRINVRWFLEERA